MSNYAIQEKKLICPYNPSHDIDPFRMAIHLMKCEKNYPKIKLAKCRYDATHRFPAAEMGEHEAVCPNKKSLELYMLDFQTMGGAGRAAKPAIDNEVKLPPVEMEENWDDEECPRYNPRAEAAKKAVIRNCIGLKPAERRAFREQERLRLQKLKQEQE